MQGYSFAEFFSGGGMARAGLGSSWQCVLANDIDAKKCSSYRKNWSNQHLFHCDIAELPNDKLHRDIDLYWASSPCQDFSLAGKGGGLVGKKSSAFYPWLAQVEGAVDAGFAPKIIAFENVVGLLSANRGRDFAAVVESISNLGYRVGAVILDAKHFVPHSRPRLFVIGVLKGLTLPDGVTEDSHANRPSQIQKAFDSLPISLRKEWVWWNNAVPAPKDVSLTDVVEKSVARDAWFSEVQTKKLVSLMNELHREKLKHASQSAKLVVGTVYKRGRPDGAGKTIQRAELRLDGVAGCLRTPGGGSSRQTVMFIEGDRVQARLLTTLEAARLMGLPDWYQMPENYNDAYHLAGDGVVVPVVRHLAERFFETILSAQKLEKAA